MALHGKQIGLTILMLGAMCLMPMEAFSDEPEPFIMRVSIVPDSDIWVGQRVLLQIDILGRNSWAKIQRLPDVEVPGVILVPTNDHGVRLSETVDGEAYTGQRYELSLFPQRSGRIVVPSVAVDIEVSHWGTQSQKQLLEGAIPPIEFVAEFPPGGEKVTGLISTEQLTAEQQWEPDVSSVTVGDAIKRKINLEADNVSAMAFSPITFTSLDSVDVYPQAPKVEDRHDRGTLTARRSETASYVFKNQGSVELPAIAITWWDLQNKELRITELPSRRIEIVPSSVVKSGEMAAGGEFSWKPLVYGATVIILVIAVIMLFKKRLGHLWDKWQLEWKASEKFFFRGFLKAARSGIPTDAFNALMNWLDRIHEPDQTARLDQFLDAYADQQLAAEADRLVHAIGPKSYTRWHGGSLIKGMIKARRKWLARQKRSTTAHQRLLPLNPCNSGAVEHNSDVSDALKMSM